MQRDRKNIVELLEARRLLTVLTFDPVVNNADILPLGYGDRVTAASQNGFTYGTAGGTTQNITATFGPTAKNVRQWKLNYGNLKNVIFAGDAAKGILDITLTADLGFQTSLTSLDLAGADTTDYTIHSLTVFDGGGNALFTQSNVAVKGSGSGGSHTHVAFPSLHSRVLRIRIDATNLGANGDNVGVDNIQFSQIAGASAVGDGYADVVLSYKDSGIGPIPGPFGGNSDDVSAQPVGLGVVLGGDSEVPDYLSLPTGSSVAVGFADETVVDATGPDIAVTELVDTGERADVFVSSDLVNFTLLGIARAGRINRFDLATIAYKNPVRAVKIVGLDNNGGSPGFDVVNVQALAGSMRSENFRFPIGNGPDVPTIITNFGGDNPAHTQHGSFAEEYASPVGKSVFPFMWGKVQNVITGDASLGNAVIVEHTLIDNTKIYSIYAHLSKVSVSVGTPVTTSTKIGLTGATGDSTSANLRFGIFAGDPSTAGMQYRGTNFSNSLASQTDVNGVIHYKPSTFITAASALNIGFASMSDTGVINVTGTDAADKITLNTNDGTITVNGNGIVRAFEKPITTGIFISALAGDDRVTINGDILGIYVDGGAGNDSLSGGNGKDTLTGGAGKNTLLGNAGDDRLNGSGSRDNITGGEGADRLYGNDGNDTLSGDGGVDRLFGGNGDDALSGGSSNDKLYGEAGNDTLSGNNQNDLLEGGSGNDSLLGNAGADTLRGNADNDFFNALDGAIDSLDGGSGTDKGRLDPNDNKVSIESIL